MISFSLHPSTVELNSISHEELMAACNIDLQTPDALCTFFCFILPNNGSTFAVAKVTTDSNELIRLCQQSMVDVIGSVDQQYSPMEVTGTYDCETATTMLRIAELLKEDIGEATDWAIGPREFLYLIGQCKDFQDQAKASLQPMLGFQLFGVLPIMSTTSGRFIAALPPQDCSPAHLHLEDSPIPSTGLEAVSYLKGVEGVGNSSSRSGLGFWSATLIGVALAVGSAAAFQYWKGQHA